MAKSKIYTQDDGSKVAFEFGDDGKLIGIKKKEDGSIFPKSLDPQSKEFEDLQDGDDALEAYNINKFKGNVDSYLKKGEVAPVDTDVLIAQHEREEKKENNAQFLEDNTLNKGGNLAFTTPKTGSAYNGGKTGYDAKKRWFFWSWKTKSINGIPT